MITKLRVKNFKALRDVEIDLTPIHVLIGPNDSGKTSILDALAALCRSVDHNLTQSFLGSWKGAELVWAGQAQETVTIEAELNDDVVSDYGMAMLFGTQMRDVSVKSESLRVGTSTYDFPSKSKFGYTSVKNLHDNPALDGPHSDEFRRVHRMLAGVHYYRLNPSFLSLPVAADAKRRFKMESNGFGLALLLDEILSFDRKRFDQLENRFTETFRDIASIALVQESAYRAPVDNPDRVTMLQQADGKGLYFKLKESGQLVPASQASDGTLLVLAYLAVLYLPEPPRLLLIEEPENGIHPKRLRDVLAILRDLVREQVHTQVILTTHSPYAVDLFKPEEVTLCTKTDTGEIKTTRLSDSPDVVRQLGVFTLGEIWTSEGDEKIAESKNRPQGTGE